MQGQEPGCQRPGAERFPLMVVISIIYPCNFGCPNCPYTDANSSIRRFYRERRAELLPVDLWSRMADECGRHAAWMRCTGGGEPMLHPRMPEMIERAKASGARVWLNTNGSLFGPSAAMRGRLERILRAGIDLIEFSMDAGDAETYARVRPPHGGPPRDPQAWWDRQVGNVRAALEMRHRFAAGTRVVVSLIRQKQIEGRLAEATAFWLQDVGVDEVLTRKFLTWDGNTRMEFGRALDAELYSALPPERAEPCVWPFERLNVDTLGRVALCGQDIAFRTAGLFPTVQETSLEAIWRGERFTRYRRMHLEGRGAACWPCGGCSAWLAGIRDWEYGWLRVLKTSGERLRRSAAKAPGVAVEPPEPQAEHDAPGGAAAESAAVGGNG